jgi:lysophospholipase L1-like esterase
VILRPVGIACFGTSLTTGRLSGGWPQKLQDKLNGVSRRRVICYDVGQGSQTSAWGVANIDRPRNHRPDICLIEFSINDSVTSNGISISQATANLTSIVSALRAVNPNVLIYLMTMNGCPDLAARPDLEAYYQNDRNFAAANGCGLIDIRPVWGTPNYTDTPDGLHPTEAAVAAKLLPTVFGVLAPIVAAETLPTTPPPQPPVLASVSPGGGPLAGGTTITLAGSNLTGATGVTIGGVAATSVNVVNASTVTCVTPAGSAGPKDVVITTPAGSSTRVGGFNYGAVTFEFLLLAGGGGGGSGVSGGGGGGGLLTGVTTSLAVGSYPVGVGLGGLGGSKGGPRGADGADGGDSTFNGLTAKGGGGGRSRGAGWPGGSGGGAGGYSGSAQGGAATSGQGSDGGACGPGADAGGGGGAGGPGETGKTAGAAGGPGVSNTLTGLPVSYAAGGGAGGNADPGYELNPGPAGGPSAGNGGLGTGGSAPANRGGGGGGGGAGAGGVYNQGGDGGSGLFIARYPTGTATCTGGNISTSGGYTIHTFNGSGTFQRTA